MAPKVLFDGEVDVSYRFVYLDSGVGGPDQEVVMAAAAVRGAGDPDPFAAALQAVEAASWSEIDEDAFFAEIDALVR